MNLAPLPLLNTDGFEAKHSPHKQTRLRKRSSVNILLTLIKQDERASVYNSTGETLPEDIEKTIKRQCTGLVVSFHTP